MKNTVTQWFGMDEYPEHVGPYELRYASNRHEGRFSFWNGANWMCSDWSVWNAVNVGAHIGVSTDCYNGWVDGWRGLAEKPE